MNADAASGQAPRNGDHDDVRVRARSLGFDFGDGGPPLWAGLDFDIRPGLTLVRGGDGRGKSTLLRVIAGHLVPTAGRIERRVTTQFDAQPGDAADDTLPAHAWLARQRAAQAGGWQADVAQALVEAFALEEHLGKRLEMLSTGSRRKVGWVAAAASGAALTLVDMPFAALDGPSCRAWAQVLSTAASARSRAWVMADYTLPHWLDGVPLAATIDLGD